jgi:hypothetical protein
VNRLSVPESLMYRGVEAVEKPELELVRVHRLVSRAV